MLVATKISINAINDDQKEFVFNLMKEHSVDIFFSKKKKKLRILVRKMCTKKLGLKYLKLF